MEAADADAKTCDNMRAAFLSILRNRSVGVYPGNEQADLLAPVRILEKTPRNCLRANLGGNLGGYQQSRSAAAYNTSSSSMGRNKRVTAVSSSRLGFAILL
jgi:hypothetical protein